jgi:plastocyanin domain-containing protein
MAWVKTTGTQYGIVMSWGAEQAGQKWMFRVESGGGIGVGVWGGYSVSQSVVNDGQWHHVAAVLEDDGTPTVAEIRFYIDGVLQTALPSNTQSIETASSQDVRIGAYENAGNLVSYFSGLMDEVRIYDYALTGQEIQQLIN